MKLAKHASERTTTPQEKKRPVPLQATNAKASFFPTDEAILKQQANNKRQQERERPLAKAPSQPRTTTANTTQTKAQTPSSPPKKSTEVLKWVAKAKEHEHLAHLVKALDLVPH